MTYYIDQLQPGMSASTSKTVTETDIILFAGIQRYIIIRFKY